MEPHDAVLRALATPGALTGGGEDLPEGIASWLRTVVAFWSADPRVADFALDAQAAARTPAQRSLARAASDFAAALDATPTTALAAATTHLASTSTTESREDAGEEGALAEFFLAEAALDCGRLGVAEREWGGVPAALYGDPRHPFLTLVRVSRIRSLAFQGRIDEARPLADEAVALAPDAGTRLLARCTAGLVDGNAADRRGVRALADELEASGIEPVDYLSRGCYLLATYGLVAVGDLERAARFALQAGGSADLDRLTVIDRALGLELLVALAVASDDLDAARAWATRAGELRAHPIAAPTVARLDARVALLAGEPERAIVLAERGERLATAEGRTVEAAEAGIVLARARIAARQRGAASQGLAPVVTSADDRGHAAVRRAAARELRAVGRRLKPDASAGWTGLSPREREVAVLVAQGHGNRAIGTALFVSSHTVRIHVSRVLAAFGVATRAGVAARLAGALPAPDAAAGTLAAPEARDTAAPGALTARQEEVVALLATGLGNRAIAAALGIGDRTVEKHLAEVMRRWSLPNRTAVAARASARTRARASAPALDSPASAPSARASAPATPASTSVTRASTPTPAPE